ncbi:hypothetical protein [Streptomyces cucumeris]|uniref:hypothetical protein n=1 Tax=Streptomyces cucumeris TaxID=2962890 RepID=UPI0020C919A9|nr:hypothetical protein [Streptomyces sp. NEAU-Y11]MCP9211381.1 hypothetical protein [Streptomyces sp. NEAU-Y11]
MARRSGAKARDARRAREAKRAEDARLTAKRAAPGGEGTKHRGRLRGNLWPVVGVLALLTAIGGSVLLASSQLLEDIWRDLAPRWPGGGYGFAASAGFVLFPAVAGVVVGLGTLSEDVRGWRRSRRPHHIARAAGHGVLAAASGLLGALGLVVVTTTLNGKGGARSDGLSVFLRREYPFIGYVALGGIVALLAVAAVTVKLRELLRRRASGSGTARP